jgi:hypothetical protein
MYMSLKLNIVESFDCNTFIHLARGNAHAVMVTAVSPSSFDYEETISTLKYADRAKRVRMRVEANVTSGLLATDSSGDYDV